MNLEYARLQAEANSAADRLDQAVEAALLAPPQKRLAHSAVTDTVTQDSREDHEAAQQQTAAVEASLDIIIRNVTPRSGLQEEQRQSQQAMNPERNDAALEAVIEQEKLEAGKAAKVHVAHLERTLSSLRQGDQRKEELLEELEEAKAALEEADEIMKSRITPMSRPAEPPRTTADSSRAPGSTALSRDFLVEEAIGAYVTLAATKGVEGVSMWDLVNLHSGFGGNLFTRLDTDANGGVSDEEWRHFIKTSPKVTLEKVHSLRRT